MKTGTKILNSGSKKTFNELKLKEGANFEDYQKVIKAMSLLRCEDILESDEGHILPNGLGKFIILKNLPRVSQVYSMTRPGTKIYNLHSFGWIYRVYHKEKLLLRYPDLHKFRPHRANLKVPLYNHIMNQTKDYYKHSDYI